MARFEKNNVIFDSDSEDDVSVEDSLDSDFDSPLGSSSCKPDKNSYSKKNKFYDVAESSSSHNSSSEKENSFSAFNKSSNNNNNNNSLSKKTKPEIKKKSTQEFKEHIVKPNENVEVLCDDSRQSIVQDEINLDLGEILVLDSSSSLINETPSSTNHSRYDYNKSVKTPHRLIDTEECRIVSESSDSESSTEDDSRGSEVLIQGNLKDPSVNTSDKSNQKSLNQRTPNSSRSDSSVEYVDSFSSRRATKSDNSAISQNFSIEDQSNSEPEILETHTVNKSSGTSFEKTKNAGKASGQGPSNFNERKVLEQKLADKRTAYQNILKAIRFCDPRKLSDGGQLLKERLAQCKEEINELKEKLKDLADVTCDNSTEYCPSKTNTLFSTSDQFTDNLGRKGWETHRVHAALTVDALVTLHSSLQTCPAEDALEKDPKGLRTELMPHQKYALAWLLWRENQIPAGGILADDMGLGKTLTMIALVLRAMEYKTLNNTETNEKTPFMINNVRMYHGKTLVICPSSLLGQWEGQIKKHCKSHILSCLVHHGNPRELQAKKLAAVDIVITSYGIVCEENKIIKEDKKGALFRVHWERLIIDEGHIIRNHKTKTAQALCELEAKFRWCLTGTPVHNKELDMYSLLKFLRCSPFDDYAVWKKWVDNKSVNGAQRLNTVVKSILLRRTKEELKTLGELQQLPGKTSETIYIKLDEEEQKVYHTVLQFSKTFLAEYMLQEENKLGFIREKLKNDYKAAGEIKTVEIFVLLLRLRQICCLPGLIHKMLEKESYAEVGINAEDDPILQGLTSQMKRLSVAPGHLDDEQPVERREKILVESNPVFGINRPSTKIQTVINIIQDTIESDEKVVVVSQWTNLLQKLKFHLGTLQIESLILDGTVPIKLRSRIIDSFNDSNSGVKVMLLSLTAGGVGLNLTGGSRLIIFEPHWNPQLESQACDRIYRVGQKKPVIIYKIICQNTIEEKIEILQRKKLELADTVLKGEMKFNKNKITLADLKVLFDVQ